MMAQNFSVLFSPSERSQIVADREPRKKTEAGSLAVLTAANNIELEEQRVGRIWTFVVEILDGS